MQKIAFFKMVFQNEISNPSCIYYLQIYPSVDINLTLKYKNWYQNQRLNILHISKLERRGSTTVL